MLKSEPAGKTLIEEGSTLSLTATHVDLGKPNSHLIRIKSGKLGVEKTMPDGTKKCVATIG